jgi:hypothetical protein
VFNIFDYPLVLFVVAFAVLATSARLGVLVFQGKPLDAELKESFGVVKAATLTLLGLLIGFAFSMAVSRYDQRKNLEEAEANAIGTEMIRLDLLPATEASKARTLLRAYLDLRIRNYMARDGEALRQIDAETAKLQAELWKVVAVPASAQPTPLMALVVAGMNDVLNSQGYTQAAWWNRIPTAAWGLMVVIAVCANILIGIGSTSTRTEKFLLLVSPLVIAISFLLIADIDSPRGGLIRVNPQNLHSLADSLRVP